MISREGLSHSENTSHQVQGSLGLTVALQSRGVFAINELELLNDEVKLSKYDHWANTNELVQEVETQDLHVFISIREPLDDAVDHIGLVELVPLHDILKE